MYLQTFARWAIGAILLVGSITKLLDFEWFAGVLAKYRLAPRAANKLVAFLIVSVELVAGIALLPSRWLPWSAYSASATFFLFTLAISINLARGNFDIPCGCNGFWKKTKVGWHLIFRNVGLTGLALFCGESASLAITRVSILFFILSLGLFTVSFSRRLPAAVSSI